MGSHQDWIPLEDMARLKGLSYEATKKHLQRLRVACKVSDEDGRRRLYPLSVLTPEERNKWLSEQASLTAQTPEPSLSTTEAGTPLNALELPKPGGFEASAHASALAGPAGAISFSQNFEVDSQESGSEISDLKFEISKAQPILPFAPPSPSEEARATAAAAVPRKERKYLERWMTALADHLNGTWKLYQGKEYGGFAIRNGDDFIRARARLEGVSARSFYAKLQIARGILKDTDVPQDSKWSAIADALRPKLHPGRSSAAFFVQPENAWMWPELRRIYLNQAQFSKEQAYRIFLDLLRRKQEAHGLGHYYREPTRWQVFAALEKITKPEIILGRRGESTFNDQCGMYISRDPSNLRANDLWVTDQKQVDVRMRDGGERLGRIWMVNFLDVASEKVLGYAFGPVLNSDMVMMAATMAIERYGVPKAIHMDLGKEFICKAFNGSTRKFSGEALYREAQGLWNSLAVRIVKAIGRNPQSKTIERFHANLPAFDRRFPGYCGSSPESRPEKLLTEEAQHAAWLGDKTGKAARTPLVTISQYIRAYIDWVENTWNGQTRGQGKMRRGMTPDEAYNVKRPAQGFRKISVDELEHHSAEHRFVQVSRGGQVNLTFYGQTVEYIAPELFLHQGERVEVIVSRRTFRQVTVIYPVVGGTASCIATLKPQLDWLPENRDELRAALRCKAAVHRAIRQGLEASRMALEAANPVAMLEEQGKLPGGQFGSRESRVESRESKAQASRLTRRRSGRQTSEEAADEVWKLMKDKG